MLPRVLLDPGVTFGAMCWGKLSFFMIHGKSLHSLFLLPSSISRQLSMKTGIFPCGGLCCQGGTNIYCTWLYFLTYSVRIQKTVGGVAPQTSASSWLSVGLCLGRTRLRPRVMYPKPKSEPGLVLKECSRRVTAGKKKPGMLKQNGNERFYHNFFLSLLCARSPHHQLGEKWTPPALPSPSHPYCSQ